MPVCAPQMMINELTNITNAVGADEAGAAHVFGGADARQRGLDLRQRVRRMAGAGAGRGTGIGPLSVGPPFVLASTGGVPQHRCVCGVFIAHVSSVLCARKKGFSWLGCLADLRRELNSRP